VRAVPIGGPAWSNASNRWNVVVGTTRTNSEHRPARFRRLLPVPGSAERGHERVRGTAPALMVRRPFRVTEATAAPPCVTRARQVFCAPGLLNHAWIDGDARPTATREDSTAATST